MSDPSDSQGISPVPYQGSDDDQPVVPVPLSAPVPVVAPAADLGYPSAPPPPTGVAVPPPAPHYAEAPPPPTDAGHYSQGHVTAVAAALPDVKDNPHNKEKAAALTTAILIHVALAALLTLFVVVVPGPPSSEITAIAAPSVQEQAPTTKKISEPPPQQQVTQMSASMKFVTATNASSVPMPAVEFDPQATTLDLGTTMGDFSTSFGGAGGGSISFMGNTSSGRRVVFAVDASASMNSKGKGNKSGISKFELMKQELDQSIGKLPQGTEYQILFFSAFAWPHDEVDTNNKGQWDAYRWTVKTNDPNFADNIPKFKYIKGTPENLKKSREIIKDTAATLGTLWGPPVLMALSVRPKPDIVFFMTDGTTGNPKAQIEMINDMNKKGGKRATIHTTAMMEPDAAQDLSDLAKANGGDFTIIAADGKTTKGEDFFKAQAK